MKAMASIFCAHIIDTFVPTKTGLYEFDSLYSQCLRTSPINKCGLRTEPWGTHCFNIVRTFQRILCDWKFPDDSFIPILVVMLPNETSCGAESKMASKEGGANARMHRRATETCSNNNLLSTHRRVAPMSTWANQTNTIELFSFPFCFLFFFVLRFQGIVCTDSCAFDEQAMVQFTRPPTLVLDQLLLAARGQTVQVIRGPSMQKFSSYSERELFGKPSPLKMICLY